MNNRLAAKLAAQRRWRMQPHPTLAGDKLRAIRAEDRARRVRALQRIGWGLAGFLGVGLAWGAF